MTYSLSVTGVSANHRFPAAETLTLADAQGITFQAMQQAMAQNTQFLCQGPDGAQRLYTLDAERSTPSVPILIRV